MLCLKKSNSPSSGDGDGAGIDVTIETILAAGTARGLRMQDTENMTLGMWVDYIIEWNNIHDRSDKSGKNQNAGRKATQKDFDAF